MLNMEGKRYFITLPKECLPDGEKPTRLRLLRALYGLRASPKLWYKLFKSFLEGEGWKAVLADVMAAPDCRTSACA